MAKNQFVLRIKLFVVLLISLVVLIAAGAVAVHFYIGHGVTAVGSAEDFTDKLTLGSSFTVDDVIEDQKYKYGWLKSSVKVEVLRAAEGEEYEPAEGLASYDAKTRTFTVTGVGEGKAVFSNPVDASVRFEFPFETRFSVPDTEVIVRAQYPSFYDDGYVSAEELAQITQLTFAGTEAYDLSDFGFCENFSRVNITADNVVALKGQSATHANFYVKEDLYCEYLTDAAWAGYTERVFPAADLDSVDFDSAVNVVFEFNGGQKEGYGGAERYFAAVEKDKPLELSEYEIFRTGYTFTGWFTSEDGGRTLGTQITASTNITGDIKLYADWSENSYNIVYRDDVFNTPSEKLPEIQRVKYTEKTTISDRKPVQAGREFLYWEHDDLHFTPQQEVEMLAGEDNADYVLYAAWRTNSYKIVYDGNGGSGAPAESESIEYDASYVLSTKEPTRTGYTFIGWSKSKDATKATYFVGNTVSRLSPSGTAVLYAVWAANQYTVSFDAAGGNAVSSIKVTYDKAYSLPTASRSGYYFYAWYVSGGSTRYDNSGIWRTAGNVHLKADWASATAIYTNNSRLKITSDSASKNSYDTINLNSCFGYSLSVYKAGGATKIKFDITVYISEIDDGYQEIYLCRYAQSSNAVWSNTKIEHGSGHKDSSNWAHKFSVTVSLDSCNNTMYMNYGANGKFSNDWYRNSIEIRMTIF